MTKINQQRLVEHFISLVKIDSESGNEKAVAEALAEQLGLLGFDVTKLAVPGDITNGFNIYGKLAGELEGSIVFSSHMDTVTPGNGIEPIIEDGIIRSKGDTILGGDDKSGIAAVMEAVRSIQESGKAHKTIEVAFTVYEERGMHGAKSFDISKIESSQAIVLDSGGPIGTIITTAPGQQSLKITIKGKPAHAGLEPETGVNALTVAADAISKMQLSRIDDETTANIGVVQGGHATNIVMPELYIEAEARSLDDVKLAKQVNHMVSTFEAVALEHGASVEIDSIRSYNAYHIADDDAHVLEIKETFAAIGIDAMTKSTGGGSDANIFNVNGLKTVNLSTGMAKVHTTDEFISVADLAAITEFVHCYLTR
ncbi:MULTISPECIES: M20/M25/M40 family metallo-hydrolase [unclassified Shewanella]|uniref:M20/M25/M40 family metallo-hydrolase n=1 Tax=unclassified Shewanella TaxID=196818 RepID=UPI001BC6A0F4|nr:MULTISPECIES: M20/M25/M40 family metallo-hydrolase [unclassified Shewanella]GIU05158.1 peptidase M20 [Shewanella sp. MBTL60-112-B1]GIU24326.1 peptidase M20 [Shewanella sp. MBTL60-112-B2]